MTILQRVASQSIFVLVLLSSVSGHAQPTAATAVDEVKAAQDAFAHGEYVKALQHYQRAFAVDSSSMNAVRVSIASCYAEQLSAAIDHFDVWLQKKRDDAKKTGDRDESWGVVRDAVSALEGAARRQEQQIARLEADSRSKDAEIQSKDAEIQRLKDEVQVRTVTVQSMQENFERERAALEAVRRELDVVKERVRDGDKAVAEPPEHHRPR